MIRIPIKAEGADDVKAALRSIKDAYADLEHTAIASSAKIASAQIHDAERIAEARKKANAAFDGGVGRGGGDGAGGSRAASGGGGTTAGDLFGVGNLESSINSATASIAKMGLIGIGISAFKSGLDMATEALKSFGGFVINEVMAPALRLDATAQQVANASGGKLTADFVTKSARTAGLANNMDPGSLIKGASVFQDLTGDPKLSFELLSDVAKVAKSRGADPAELMKLMGSVHQKGMTADDMRTMFYGMIGQGDSGSVTIAQQGAIGGRVGGVAGQFAGDRVAANQKAWAIIQNTAKPLGGSAEAATALANFANEGIQVAMKTPGLKGNVVTGKDKVSKIVDPMQLIADLLMKTGGDSTKLKKMGFTDTSARLVGAFQQNYRDDYDAAKGRGLSDKDAIKEGALGVKDALDQMAAATVSSASESAGRDAVMATTAEKWDAAIAQMKEEVLKAKPALEALAKNLIDHAPEIGRAALTITEALISVADWIEEHIGGGSSHKAQRRRDAFEQGQATLAREIEAGKAAGTDTAALEKEKATKAAAQQRTEDTLSALQAIPLDQDSKYAANLRAAGGAGIGPNGEVSPEAATKNYERVMSLIQKDPTAEIGSYASGSFSPAQTEVLEKFRQAQLGDMKGNIEGGAKGVDTESLQASIAKATAEFEKMTGAAQALNRSKAFGG